MASSKPRPPRPATEFTLFNKLPQEIRFMIWEFSRFPRIVYIRKVQLKDRGWVPVEGGGYARTKKKLWGIKSNCPLPAMLLANHESFLFASKFYQRVFAHQNPLYPAIAQTWFDFEKDILYVDKNTFLEIGDSGERYRVPNMVIDTLKRSDVDDIHRVQNLALDRDIGLIESDLAELLGLLGPVQNLYKVVQHDNDWLDWEELMGEEGPKAYCEGFGLYNIVLSDPVTRTHRSWCDMKFWNVEGQELIHPRRAIVRYESAITSPYPSLEKKLAPVLSGEKYQIDEQRLRRHRRGWNKSVSHLAAWYRNAEALGWKNHSENGIVGPLETSGSRDAGDPPNLKVDECWGWSEDYDSDDTAEDEVFSRAYGRYVRRWKTPKIHYKVIMSAKMKRKLELAQELHDAVISKNVEEHRLHSSANCKCRGGTASLESVLG